MSKGTSGFNRWIVKPFLRPFFCPKEAFVRKNDARTH
jgi:hypothetical protein